MEIKWTLRSEGRVLVEKSVNEVFVTLVAPECDTLYRTVAYLACSNTGAEDEDVALAHTWNLFSTGSGPADVCGWNDETRSYDRPLHYYLERGPGGALADLLADGDGQCSAWAELLWESLLVNGVDNGVPVVVHPRYLRLLRRQRNRLRRANIPKRSSFHLPA